MVYSMEWEAHAGDRNAPVGRNEVDTVDDGFANNGEHQTLLDTIGLGCCLSLRLFCSWGLFPLIYWGKNAFASYLCLER